MFDRILNTPLDLVFILVTLNPFRADAFIFKSFQVFCNFLRHNSVTSSIQCLLSQVRRNESELYLLS